MHRKRNSHSGSPRRSLRLGGQHKKFCLRRTAAAHSTRRICVHAHASSAPHSPLFHSFYPPPPTPLVHL